MHQIRVLAVAVVALLLVGGCAGGGDTEANPGIETCRDYRALTKYGRFTVQQAKKGGAIQWGTYPDPEVSGDDYDVSVWIGFRRFDAKKQNYAPHGSIPAKELKGASGQILRISGTVRRAGKLVLNFGMQCYIQWLREGPQ